MLCEVSGDTKTQRTTTFETSRKRLKTEFRNSGRLEYIISESITYRHGKVFYVLRKGFWTMTLLPKKHPSQVSLHICCCGAVVEYGVTIPILPRPKMGLAKTQVLCKPCHARLIKMILDHVLKNNIHDEMSVGEFRTLMVSRALPLKKRKEFCINE